LDRAASPLTATEAAGRGPDANARRFSPQPPHGAAAS
jgi:hypothetical protein